MKFSTLFLSLTLLIFVSCGSRKKNHKTDSKTVTIFYSEMYCGGAAPADELIRELSTKKLYKNKNVEVYLNKSFDLKPLILMTNDKGELKIPCDLSPLIYLNIYPSEDLFNTTVNTDKVYYQCYKSFLTENLVQINMTDKKKSTEVSVFIFCDPCVPPAP